MPAWMQLLARWLTLWNRRRLRRRHLARQAPYADWCARYDEPSERQRSAWLAPLHHPGTNPRADLLLVADDGAAADEVVAMLQAQTVPHWQFRVAIVAQGGDERARWQALAADEPRLRLQSSEHADRAAALHSLLAEADAPWLALLDPGERWRPHTLQALLAATTADTRLVFGDEDRIDAHGRRSDPWFKPHFDADALLAMDTVGAPALWRTGPLRERIGLQPMEPRAERHDLVLRGSQGMQAAESVHVSGVLAHRRGPVRPDAAAAARAVQRAFDTAGTAGRAEADTDLAAARAGLVRVRFTLPGAAPEVTIIIPTRNGLHLLERAVDSLRRRTTWPRWNLLIVDNGSNDPACLRWLADAGRDSRIRVRRDKQPFNFAALNNAAVAEATGEVVALVNNDIELLTPDWLEEMVSLALRPGVGAVGARLWYEDGSLQHGGVLLGIGEVATHTLKGLMRGDGGPAARVLRLQGYLAVTAACLVVSKANWKRVGGMDEGLAVAFNDVDFCLKLAAAGLRNLWTPHAEMLHFESVSRGRDRDQAKKARYLAEAAVMRQRWGAWIAEDPFYNRNLSSAHDDFSLAEPPRGR